MPFISVIIPLYNKETIIEQSVKSVLSQSFKDFELIIVDDGSTDNSISVVECIEDERINIIKQKNGGPGSARNNGAKNAKGEWIMFLDADDEMLPDVLINYSHLIRIHKEATLIASPFFWNNGQEKILKYSFKPGWLGKPYMAHFMDVFFTCPGSFICTKELALAHLFNEELRRYEDLEAWFRMYKNAKIYKDSKPTLVINSIYAAASRPRNLIQEDFLGHLDFKGKSFWEKMCLYKLYLWEHDYYPKEVDELYPTLRWRYDLLLLYKTLHFFKSFVN